MNQKLPYYMAYPMPPAYDGERAERMDFEYLKSMYPDVPKRILPYVEEECDRMEYGNSMMYDEYPDKLQLRLMCGRICENIRKNERMLCGSGYDDAAEAQEKAEAGKDADSAKAAEESGEEGIDIKAKPEITFEDFEKLQFQVGEILSCEEVPKSKKLLCSQVKIGSQVKQIVSGIKQHYSAQEMVGKKVMVLVNLKPAKLAGVLSEGMLLCAEDADGNLALLAPEKEMPAGAEIS